MAPGVYTTTLNVIDDSGAFSSKAVSIIVTDPNVINTVSLLENAAPVAVITAASMPSSVSDVAFDAYSSSDADGVISSYSWNFGDGGIASGDYAEHKYPVVGDYKVVLTVVDDAGASSQDSMIVSIVEPQAANIPPVAVISASLEQHLVH